MVVKVVDASAVAALSFGEPGAEAIAERLGGTRLVAPGQLAFALANVRLLKSRRHPRQQPALIAAFRLGTRLGVEELVVDHEAALEPAAATGLTAYDPKSVS